MPVVQCMARRMLGSQVEEGECKARPSKVSCREQELLAFRGRKDVEDCTLGLSCLMSLLSGDAVDEQS